VRVLVATWLVVLVVLVIAGSPSALVSWLIIGVVYGVVSGAILLYPGSKSA
jgi:hypothetical protein